MPPGSPPFVIFRHLSSSFAVRRGSACVCVCVSCVRSVCAQCVLRALRVPCLCELRVSVRCHALNTSAALTPPAAVPADALNKKLNSVRPLPISKSAPVVRA